MKVVSTIAAGLIGIAMLSIVLNPNAHTAQTIGSLGQAYSGAVGASQGQFAVKAG